MCVGRCVYDIVCVPRLAVLVGMFAVTAHLLLLLFNENSALTMVYVAFSGMQIISEKMILK